MHVETRKYYDWLRNSRGNKMQLDGFNEKNRIACEHQGIQHRVYKSNWFKSVEEFEQSKEDDKLKLLNLGAFYNEDNELWFVG